MVIRTSESVTENIFRDFYGSNVFIEKSAIPNSYGFLSKSDTENIGYPDFSIMIKRKIISLLLKLKL